MATLQGTSVVGRALLPAILLVLLTVPLPVAAQQQEQKKPKTKPKADLVCPPFSARQPTFLTVPCTKQSDCLFNGDVCCALKPGSSKSRCFQGVPRPLEEQKHEPLFGFIPTACPNPPVAEVLAVTKCSNDTECWPRVCCPDGQQRFCRTPEPHWERIPRHQQQPVLQMLRSAMKFLQCSPPPEPIFDLFARSCQFPQDCFPDLCCQEGERKVCRRPRRSLLSLFSYLAPSTTAEPSPEPKTLDK
ncbi:hypothetical protein B566_EDAN007701, partial [Ephemera danica]